MKQNCRIRRARNLDLEEIAAIESYWPTSPHWSQNQLNSELFRKDSVFLAAEIEGLIVGYCFARIVEKEAQLLSLSTHPKQLRQGIARKLLGIFFEEARSRGCSHVTLEVSKLNAQALRLYQATGFQVVGGRSKFYNDGSDALLMDISL